MRVLGADVQPLAVALGGEEHLIVVPADERVEVRVQPHAAPPVDDLILPEVLEPALWRLHAVESAVGAIRVWYGGALAAANSREVTVHEHRAVETRGVAGGGAGGVEAGAGARREVAADAAIGGAEHADVAV